MGSCLRTRADHDADGEEEWPGAADAALAGRAGRSDVQPGRVFGQDHGTRTAVPRTRGTVKRDASGTQRAPDGQWNALWTARIALESRPRIQFFGWSLSSQSFPPGRDGPLGYEFRSRLCLVQQSRPAGHRHRRWRHRVWWSSSWKFSLGRRRESQGFFPISIFLTYFCKDARCVLGTDNRPRDRITKLTQREGKKLSCILCSSLCNFLCKKKEEEEPQQLFSAGFLFTTHFLLCAVWKQLTDDDISSPDEARSNGCLRDAAVLGRVSTSPSTESVTLVVLHRLFLRRDRFGLQFQHRPRLPTATRRQTRGRPLWLIKLFICAWPERPIRRENRTAPGLLLLLFACSFRRLLSQIGYLIETGLLLFTGQRTRPFR